MVQRVQKSYPNLVLGGGKETDEEDNEAGETDTEETDKDREETEKEPQQSQLTISQGWLRMIERVSDLTKIRWSDIYPMSVLEFLNYLAYAVSEDKRKEEQIKAWQKKH